MSRVVVSEWSKFDEIFSSWVDRTRRIGEYSFHLPWPVVADRGGMHFSSFCTVELASRRFYEVVARDEVLDLVCKHTIVIPDDTMYFKIIDWKDGRSLVTCDHNQIIGGVWLAIIDTASIPWPP